MKPVKVRLLLVREGSDSKPIVIRTPQAVSEYADELRSSPHEQVAVILLTSKNTALGLHIASQGNIDSALISADVVFKAALMGNAAAVALAHFHPSGDPTPSAEDIRVTRQMVEAGRIIGIPVLDHVILGGRQDQFQSMREAGLVDFQAA